MNKIDALKSAAHIIVGIGTARITKGIIANNAPNETLIDKISVYGASIVIGGMASEATKNYTTRMIDDVEDAVRSIKNK